MAEIINMPRLSDTMEEGTVVKWLKKVGDKIQEGDILAEIETDKATMEFESFNEGTLLHIGIQEGEKANVDTLLAIIGQENEDISTLISGKTVTDWSKSNESSKHTNEEVQAPPNTSREESKPTIDSDILDNVHIVKMPQLSDTMEEGKVIKWIKKVGDQVEEGEILAEIESDKAVMEFEAFEAGTLLHIGINEGESAQVDKLLAVIGPKDTDISQVLKWLDSSNETTKSIDAVPERKKTSETPRQIETLSIQEAYSSKNSPNDHQSALSSHGISTDSDRILASPLAKKLAKDKGIALNLVKGSGTNGRIIKRDIEHFNPGTIQPTSFTKSLQESIIEIPNTPMRKAIAKRLSASKFSAPHYYLTIEYNAENLVDFRQQYNASGQYKVSFNDIILKAVAHALKQHQQVNARWEDQKIIQHEHVHLGVAIGVEDGLVVPVIRFADQRKIHDLGTIVKDFALRAKEKKLKQNEIEGSTFTVSNLGMFGIEEFTSIINLPNVAILSIGAIIEKPIVKDGQIVIGKTIKVTLANDHRVVDGITGSKFLQSLKELIENPISLIV